MNATIQKNLIAVKPSERDGQKWITIDLPEGWDTLKKLTNKVLQFDGQNYTFRGWNSDRNEAFLSKIQTLLKLFKFKNSI